MSEPVRVRSRSHHRFVQELEAREHHWLADKPPDTGGNGLGPSPFELLLGSFAAQTSVGILDLAIEKEWAVDVVEVELAGETAERGSEGEGAASDEAGAGPSMDLVRRIRVRGELNEEERRELETSVAERWPRESWLPPGGLRDEFSYVSYD